MELVVGVTCVSVSVRWLCVCMCDSKHTLHFTIKLSFWLLIPKYQAHHLHSIYTHNNSHRFGLLAYRDCHAKKKEKQITNIMQTNRSNRPCFVRKAQFISFYMNLCFPKHSLIYRVAAWQELMILFVLCSHYMTYSFHRAYFVLQFLMEIQLSTYVPFDSISFPAACLSL